MTTGTTGSVDFFVEGQTYQTWSKIIGDLTTPGAHRPLVILHGGPGLDHGYVLYARTLLINSAYCIDSNYSDLMRCFMKRPGKRKNLKIDKEQLTSRLSSIPIVFYDQLGGGRSTHRPDAPKDFWTPELFMDELDNLLKHLHIQDDFDLLGHSWGGEI